MIPRLNETQGALLRLLPTAREQESDKLPVLTTAADIRELIQYLRRKPAGVIATEELDRPKKRLFDDRKLKAYEVLGITTLEDQTLRLTPLGWRFARRMESEAEVFRYFLDRHPRYATALNWVSRQNIDMITSTELCDFWHGTHAEAFPFDDQEAIRGTVISFFSICQAAGLGTMTLGKRGHITRFFVDRDELAKFLTERPAASLLCEGTAGSETHNLFVGPVAMKHSSLARADKSEALTVRIQCRNPRIVELIQRTLEIANVRSQSVGVVWDRNPLADESVESSRREFCALITVLGEESFTKDHTGTSVIKESVLMELGAAHVLYDRRVILLADRASASYAGIKDLICYEFDGERLDWEVGLQLIKLVSEFQEKAQQTLPVRSPLARGDISA